MLKYIKGRLAVSYCELVDRSVKATELGQGVITHNQYRYLNRKKLFELAQANAPGQTAFYFYDSLPERVKGKLSKKYPGGIYKAATASHVEKFYKYDDIAYTYYFNHELGFSDAQIKRYTANASVVQAVIACLNDRSMFQKALGNPGRRTVNFSQIMDELEAKRNVWHHTFRSERTLRRAINRFKKHHYDGLYNRNQGNKNAAKIIEQEQEALLRMLLGNYRNLDHEQVADLYNGIASERGWDTITRQTIANYREQVALYADAGSRGLRHHQSTNNMQVKRKRPSTPLYYWTLDGWDAELMYQKTVVDKKGRSVTTYHNRLNVVMVLDPSCKYIVGYSVADTESGNSIKSALRNAVTHMKELFGEYYFPFQLQSDNFASKEMGSFYTKMTEKYTPAAVGNAKSKIIEPFFKAFNKRCQLEGNWSGFGMTARKENQPNAEYLNTTIVKHSFPDRAGAVRQVEAIINKMRMESMAEFVSKFNATDDKQYMTREMYLYNLGETTGYTNRLEGSGLNVTINKIKRVYDTFDMDFRLKHRNVDWIVKFDPNNLKEVLVHNEDGKHRFILEKKYLQPMALKDREEGDAEELQKVFDYNKQLKAEIMKKNAEDYEIVNEMMAENKMINDTLSKLIITDSLGQHKSNKQQARIAAATSFKIEKMQGSLKNLQEKEKEAVKREKRQAYIDNKVNADVLNDLYGI